MVLMWATVYLLLFPSVALLCAPGGLRRRWYLVVSELLSSKRSVARICAINEGIRRVRRRIEALPGSEPQDSCPVSEGECYGDEDSGPDAN